MCLTALLQWSLETKMVARRFFSLLTLQKRLHLKVLFSFISDFLLPTLTSSKLHLHQSKITVMLFSNTSGTLFKYAILLGTFMAEIICPNRDLSNKLNLHKEAAAEAENDSPERPQGAAAAWQRRRLCSP